MAAEMREATCAGTQTSKAPTLSGPSVTNHYSVVVLTWAQITIGILYSGIAHERQPNFRHRKKNKKKPRNGGILRLRLAYGRRSNNYGGRRCAYKTAKHDGLKLKMPHLRSNRGWVNKSSSFVFLMGINGLLPFLKNYHKKVNLCEFSGKTTAIDASCWIHKALASSISETGNRSR